MLAYKDVLDLFRVFSLLNLRLSQIKETFCHDLNPEFMTDNEGAVSK
jgi:hypothetical protein